MFQRISDQRHIHFNKTQLKTLFNPLVFVLYFLLSGFKFKYLSLVHCTLAINVGKLQFREGILEIVQNQLYCTRSRNAPPTGVRQHANIGLTALSTLHTRSCSVIVVAFKAIVAYYTAIALSMTNNNNKPLLRSKIIRFED